MLPPALLSSLQTLPGFHQPAFEAVHNGSEQVVSVRINPAKINTAETSLPLQHAVAWSRYGYYLSQRPSFTLDPLFHAGCYYVQEASSMFLEQALMQHADMNTPLKILDLCAAPGGKSTHLLSLTNENSLVVSNEVIQQRAGILEENITRWGAAHTIITQNDPAHFARLPHFFDVVVVDAPCSGSGLFRKDTAAIAGWSENNVALCSQRQQRILASVWPALKPGGLLIYSTCSYSVEEDEQILNWLHREFNAAARPINIHPGWKITEVIAGNNMYGYRFWPHLLLGEGFFLAAVQKTGGEAAKAPVHNRAKTSPAGKQEAAIVQGWLQPGHNLQLIKHAQEILALPPLAAEQLAALQKNLFIKKAGIACGTVAGNNLLPAHALAMSRLLNGGIPAVELDKETALRYLRRDAFETGARLKGWAMARFNGHNLGWMKLLGNRINNYYPKHYRILMALD